MISSPDRDTPKGISIPFVRTIAAPGAISSPAIPLSPALKFSAVWLSLS